MQPDAAQPVAATATESERERRPRTMAASWQSLRAEYLHLEEWLRIPWQAKEFWATQLLVIAIAIVHDIVEVLHLFPSQTALYFVPYAFFLIPVVYAATAFGAAGSVPTALWCTALSVPNWVLWHEGGERAGGMFQMAVIIVVAAFVGTRVEQQRKARAQAEAAGQALRVSEQKYRGLFESAGEGVLVLAHGDTIVECNPAAGRLLRRPAAALRGRRLRDVLSADAVRALSRALAAPQHAPVDIALGGPNSGVWVEPVCTPLPDAGELMHVVLRDVSAQKSRQQQLETFAGAVLTAQEEERRRVAHELHDETVQSLVHLCRMIDDCARGEVGGTGVPDLRARTETIVADIRRFVHGLRPPALDDLGLVEALERQVRDVAERSGLEWEFDVKGHRRRLSGESELALFRIAQEALHNVERHSGAKRIRVRLRYTPRLARLAVADDGAGFDMRQTVERSMAEHKLGLMGMHERARIVGGTLAVESSTGHGTTVVVEVPTGA